MFCEIKVLQRNWRQQNFATQLYFPTVNTHELVSFFAKSEPTHIESDAKSRHVTCITSYQGAKLKIEKAPSGVKVMY